MEYVKPILAVIALFLLSCLLCWVAGCLTFLGPIFGLFFFLVGVMGVLLTVDSLWGND